MVKSGRTSWERRFDELERRIAAQERKRIAAGSGIRITETDSETLLIEAEEPPGLPAGTDAGGEPETAPELMPGYGIVIDREGESIRVALDRSALPDCGWQNVFGSMQDFPFRVAVSGLAAVRGLATDIAVGGGVKSLVFAGTNRLVEVQPATFTVSQAGFVILRITADLNGAYATLLMQDQLPAVTDTAFWIPLARISYDTDYAVVQQMHFGNVHVAGRII